jgi:hypothetical protein
MALCARLHVRTTVERLTPSLPVSQLKTGSVNDTPIHSIRSAESAYQALVCGLIPKLVRGGGKTFITSYLLNTGAPEGDDTRPVYSLWYPGFGSGAASYRLCVRTADELKAKHLSLGSYHLGQWHEVSFQDACDQVISMTPPSHIRPDFDSLSVAFTEAIYQDDIGVIARELTQIMESMPPLDQAEHRADERILQMQLQRLERAKALKDCYVLCRWRVDATEYDSPTVVYQFLDVKTDDAGNRHKLDFYSFPDLNEEQRQVVLSSAVFDSRRTYDVDMCDPKDYNINSISTIVSSFQKKMEASFTSEALGFLHVASTHMLSWLDQQKRLPGYIAKKRDMDPNPPKRKRAAHDSDSEGDGAVPSRYEMRAATPHPEARGGVESDVSDGEDGAPSGGAGPGDAFAYEERDTPRPRKVAKPAAESKPSATCAYNFNTKTACKAKINEGTGVWCACVGGEDCLNVQRPHAGKVCNRGFHVNHLLKPPKTAAEKRNWLCPGCLSGTVYPPQAH